MRAVRLRGGYNRPGVKRCYITDRKRCNGNVLDAVEAAAAAGVDWIQIREKDLSARALLDLVRAALARTRNRPAAILVNSRMDVALAAGAGGVHLTSDAPPPRRLRAIAPAGFLLGVSTHTPEEAERAAVEGTDFAVFGPVFPTASKPAAAAVPGLEKLAEACARAGLPVLALGGITPARIRPCLDAGAAGIAGISMFQGG